MAKLKNPKIGVYGNKQRKLQERMSYERVSQTWKNAFVYLYLGSRTKDEPNLKDVQIGSFMEVPDRAYDLDPKEIHIYFEPENEMSQDLSRYGIVNPMGNENIVKIHTWSYECLGRPVRSGDVLEIPFFEQDCTKKAFWEVNEIDRSQEFERFYATLYIVPLDDSRTVREIPKTNSNIDDLEALSDQMHDIFDADIPHSGVDTDGLDVVDPNEDMNEPFDPQSNENQRSFMDGDDVL